MAGPERCDAEFVQSSGGLEVLPSDFQQNRASHAYPVAQPLRGEESHDALPCEKSVRAWLFLQLLNSSPTQVPL